MNCTCGHAYDEHDSYPATDPERLDYADCLADDCDCILYEWDGEEED